VKDLNNLNNKSMRTFFEAAVRYARENEQGLLKNVSEKYLVDAVSHTEAEATVYDMLGSVIRGDFQIKRLVPANITDIFIYDDTDTFFKCRVSYIVADEISGKEKKVNQNMLVTAGNVKEAYDRIHESLSNMLVSFTVPAISESPIIEVFLYEKGEEG